MEQFFSVNIGQILQTLLLLCGGFLALGSLKNEVKTQGEGLRRLDQKIDKLETAFVELARQEERLNAMDQRMMTQGRRLDIVTNQVLSKYGRTRQTPQGNEDSETY